MPRRNLLLLLLVSVFSYACYVRGQQNPFARYVASSYEMIDDWALIEVPDSELYASAVDGMVGVLQRHGDEHSRFITPEDARAFQAEMRQQFGGIGVRIRIEGEPPQPTVVGPPEPGTPAFRADVRAGDTIVKIDDQPTANWDMLQVLRSMRGEVGASIKLSVVHTESVEPVDIELTREIITIDSILGDRRASDESDSGTKWIFQLETDPQIGYIRIIHFGDKTVAELAQVLTDLKALEVQAVILDLRDNAGGALDAAVAISDMFLPEGVTIVETRGRKKTSENSYTSSGDGQYTQLPLAVLINQYSASASEIVAACLQDHYRATIIGQRSYGKGTVQRVLEVGSRGTSLLKLTSASYWRPSGKNIHRMKDDGPEQPWGVVPDEEHKIELDDEEYVNYRRMRSNRDMIKPTDDNGDAAEFVDRVLLNAVECMQGDAPE